MGIPSFINAYPQEQNTGWHENVQGITHDGSHWFITQTERLWRIPFTHDLNTPASSATGVSIRHMNDFQELSSHGHFGDCVHIAGRVLVPTTSEILDPVIAVFDATDLALLDVHTMSGLESLGWLAVHEQSDTIWMSENHVSYSSPIRRFGFNRALLDGPGQLSLSSRPDLVLRQEDGRALKLEYVQGGVIGDDDLLYLANGFPDPTVAIISPIFGADDGVPRELSGLHVIDPRSGNRLAKSSPDALPFKFSFDPTRPEREEPEGITWADVDGLGLPGISGQLHALLLDNETLTDDDVHIIHYTVDQTPYEEAPPIRVVTNSRRNAQGVIEALCNPDESWSPRLVSDVIEDIETASFRYVVNDLLFGPGIHIVRMPNSNAYIRSNPDLLAANNLDNLPPCS